MPHICHEEIFAFLAALAGLGHLGRWFRMKWYSHRAHCKEAQTCPMERASKEV